MFIENKYTKTYYEIITQAQSRVKPDIYTETHHIIPKSLNGTNESENLVVLTPREHFICHWLLTKMVETKKHKWQMMNALGYMMWAINDNQERYKVNARLYEQLKTKHSEMKSWANSGKRNGMYGKKHTQEAKDKISKANTGSKLTPEQRAKVSESKLGKKREEFSEEWKAKMSKAKQGSNNNMYGKRHSKETIEKIREKAKKRPPESEETKAKRKVTMTGRKHSPETIAKMKASWATRLIT